MIELLTTAEMAKADRLAIAGGTPGIRLMENAGRAVADAVTRHSPGSGVRGRPDPATMAATASCAPASSAERGYPVRLILLGDRDKLKGDAAEASQRWSGPVEPATPDGLAGAELIVDALFGAGLDRPV